MTVLEVIQRSAEFLARKGVESPRLQVELLLAHVLKVPRLKLYLDFERKLTEPELDEVRQLVKRRANREPLQHLVGSTSFCGLEIKVSPKVLIPRPETETLAELAWKFLQGRSDQSQGGVTALDFGTGSGCLAIALAVRVPQAHVWALDSSRPALDLATENAARHGVANRIQFLESNGLERIPTEQRFDLVVSNPPYIPSQEIEELAPEVRIYDPRTALDGGPDGLQFMRLLAADAAGCLAPGGRLMCEFGDGQEKSAAAAFQANAWQIESVERDLSGRARILVASRPES